MWAITIKEDGKRFSAEKVKQEWLVAGHENYRDFDFTVDGFDKGIPETMVLASDGISLRESTQAEIDAEIGAGILFEKRQLAIEAEEEKMLLSGTTPEAVVYRTEKAKIG